MSTPIENFYMLKNEPYKSCLLALKEIILNQDISIKQVYKYGAPFFEYKGKMFCYLWADKATHEPYIGFIEGLKINNDALIQGNRIKIKILPLIASQDLPIIIIEDVLQTALNLYRNGIIKTKYK